MRFFLLFLLLAIAALAAAPCEDEARALRSTPSKPGVRAVLEACATRQNAPTARLALVVAALEGNDFDGALRHLKALKLPALADYIALYTAEAHAGLADKPATLAALAPVLAPTPRSPLLPKAALLAAAASEPAAAVALLERLRPQLQQPAADLALAQAYQAAGRLDLAGLTFARVYFYYPLSKEAALAEPAWRELGAPDNTPENVMARVDRLLPSLPSRARQDLQGIPGDLAEVRRAAADHYSRQYPAALTALRALTPQDPAIDAERTYYLYQTARRTNSDADRQSAFARLAQHHSRSPRYLDVLLLEAYRHLTENEFEAYEPLYQTCVTNFPTDPRAAFCHWKITWSNYIRRRPAAADLLREHAEKYPHSDKVSAALYFLGRLNNDPTYYQAVVARYPNTYYSLIATDRLKENAVSLRPNAWLSQLRFTAPPAIPAQESAASRLRIERARLLLAAGLDTQAEVELRYGAREEQVPLHVAMELAGALQRAGKVDRGVRTIKGLLPGYLTFPFAAVNEKFWQLAFPIPYRASLEKYARQAEIDPFVFAGLIRQESEFNASVVSPSNAYGLSQILPSTGRDLSRRVGMKNFTPRMLFDPTTNIHLGTYYIRHLLNSLEGNWHEALAAYNGGRTRVIKWRTFAQYREPAEFIETIPFDETRGYVQAVLRNAAVYKTLYEGKSAEIAYPDPDPPPPPAVTAAKPAVRKAAPAKPAARRARRPATKK
jgi:soluble lytic murein transglycosylase